MNSSIENSLWFEVKVNFSTTPIGRLASLQARHFLQAKKTFLSQKEEGRDGGSSTFQTILCAKLEALRYTKPGLGGSAGARVLSIIRMCQ